jgi:4-carboxymuconolactone decarboxylase
MTEEERHAKGMQIRRQVLGNDYVDAAVARQNAFNRDFQDYVTRGVWGSIWTRPGLDLKTRSCMVLTTMMALGHWDEFRLHVRAAFNNGLTKDDIKEVILQTTAYCGAPVGNHAMREAETVFQKEGL